MSSRDFAASFFAAFAAFAFAFVLCLAVSATGCSPDRERQARQWTGGEPSRGAQAMRRYGCTSCHTIPGVTGAVGLVGPPLDHLASRVYIAGHVPNTPANLMRFLAHPHGTDRQTAMPEMGIPDRDVRDLAAYLYTLR
ncbi:MAG TPA: c-type cytochrome [Thermoanaerobaculia bacterium]